MKKGKKMLLLLGVFVLLIIVYLVLGNYNDDKARKEAEKTVHVTDISDLTGISYTDGSQTISFVKEKKKWYVKDDKDFPLSKTIPETLEKTLKKLPATRELKDADNLEDYGLKEPAATITLTAKDGKETKLYVGSAAGQDIYAADENKAKIYTVSGEVLGDLPYDLNSMVEMDTFPTIGEDNLEEAAVTKGGKTTTYKADDKKQKKAIATIQGGLGTFAFSSCANYSPSEKDMSTYGLDEKNRTTVKITYKDDDKKTKTVTLYVGKADETGQNYYVQKDGSSMVNLSAVSAVDSILNKES